MVATTKKIVRIISDHLNQLMIAAKKNIAAITYPAFSFPIVRTPLKVLKTGRNAAQ
ncbi:MAG: hypothetical protein Q7S53_05565 [bacterium]|nr:hypothetical protein [bacterium]